MNNRKKHLNEDKQYRVQFDFELTFLNGGGLQGQDFRLDIAGEDVSDEELSDFIIRDLRLLMVDRVRILHKTIIREPHKRASEPKRARAEGRERRLVDLSHTIEHGMVTYRGLPAPVICDFWSREESRAHYAPGTEFQIGRIEMVANTGTYVDSPFHRFADGADLAGLSLRSLADLKAVVMRVTGQKERAIRRTALAAAAQETLAGGAVLIHTGWDRYWRTDAYFEGHPFLTEDAADYLVEAGAALVGIDSLNIDDTSDGRRPVHTRLLGAGIPIVEHLCNLDQLPLAGFRFSAVPVKVRGMGSFPVRAYAQIDERAIANFDSLR